MLDRGDNLAKTVGIDSPPRTRVNACGNDMICGANKWSTGAITANVLRGLESFCFGGGHLELGLTWQSTDGYAECVIFQETSGIGSEGFPLLACGSDARK